MQNTKYWEKVADKVELSGRTSFISLFLCLRPDFLPGYKQPIALNPELQANIHLSTQIWIFVYPDIYICLFKYILVNVNCPEPIYQLVWTLNLEPWTTGQDLGRARHVNANCFELHLWYTSCIQFCVYVVWIVYVGSWKPCWIVCVSVWVVRIVYFKLWVCECVSSASCVIQILFVCVWIVHFKCVSSVNRVSKIMSVWVLE